MSASEDDPADPLDGADVGDTRRVTHTSETWVGNYYSEAMQGSDRQLTDLDVDAETYTDERGDHMIRLTFDGEVMKTLPRRWDHCREPLTQEEKQTERRRKWLGWAGRAASLAIPFGVGLWVATQMMSMISGKMTINGEPVTAPTFAEIAPLAGAVFLFVVLIGLGLQGGFPGMAGRRWS